ncbi:hypothetical protein HL667_00080 [Bradyrhizobium sp. 83012]|uniref:Phage tail protein n=1 Tax=Bradyrhizobium aeschynomenes TaxID=2734909 RepID=A0ABX2C513_9BRAD|nr:hypothetical protein [Bradyrhizobium aeschynomenes]NPU63392.1 hypothetical protein [Bradyrhizobium aeschynomenes]
MATLARHQFTVLDAAGNIVPSAHVEVRKEVPGQPLAALYADRLGATPLGNPFDADAEGFAFFHVEGGAFQIRVYTGPSGAPTFEAPLFRWVAIGLNAEADTIASRTQRVVTAAGAVTVTADDADDVIIRKTVGAATAVTMPDAAAAPKRPKKIVDGKGDANTNNITIAVQIGQTMMGIINGTYTIDGNGGMVELTPLPDGTGWY